jgi:uncharacterized protein (TIGR02453 family)
MSTTTYFDKKSLRFLHDLALNNDRVWFAENKQRYEETVRQPYLRLIADMAEPLAKISTHFRADPRTQGGSLFRIYRDTRFAGDKRPYKTHAGARFFHERHREVAAPSFYLHIEPNACFIAGGLWHPESATLKRIREFLVENPSTWKKAVHNKNFAQRFGLGGESLTRPPRGYPIDHELIEDIKRKDFIAAEAFTDKVACSAELRDVVVAGCKGLAPMIDYLCAALDLEF